MKRYRDDRDSPVYREKYRERERDRDNDRYDRRTDRDKDRQRDRDHKDYSRKKRQKSDKHRRRSRTPSDSDDSEDRYKREAKQIAKDLQRQRKDPLYRGTVDGQLQTEVPAGDTFVWEKKIQKKLQDGGDTAEFSEKQQKERQLARLQELQKVREARAIREADQVRQREELDTLQRLRAQEEQRISQVKGDEFHLNQLLLKAQERLKQECARPIDVIAKALLLQDKFPLHKDPPHMIMQQLGVQELHALHKDIQDYAQVDSIDQQHALYWELMGKVCKQEIATRSKEEQGAAGGSELDDANISAAMVKEIKDSIKDHGYTELLELYNSTNDRVQSGASQFYQFDQAMLSYITPQLNFAQLTYIHAGMIEQQRSKQREQYLQQQKKEEGRQESEDERSGDEEGGVGAGGPASGQGRGEAVKLQGLKQGGGDEEEGKDGVLTPVSLRGGDIGEGEEVVDEDEDWRALEEMRAEVARAYASIHVAGSSLAASQQNQSDAQYHQLIRDPVAGAQVHPMLRNVTEIAPQAGDQQWRSGGAGLGTGPSAEDKSMLPLLAAARQRMGNDAGDREFGGEVELEGQFQAWHDQYAARKPKYFNRVHTGYEWNKYNQTHYDSDNPPPKVVQGYKFNLFYPDLVDAQQTPQYRVLPNKADKDGSTCILKFSAGAPYEDIAFRIVNKEWEYSHKKGFKCVFERGVLHLYFNFKRARYRR